MNSDLMILAPALLLSILSVSCLVASDWHQFRAGRLIFKPLAALCFIWLALLLGAPQTSYGQWLLLGFFYLLGAHLFLSLRLMF